MTGSKSDVRVRRAHSTDAARMAELCGQLGYPVGAKEMARRLSQVLLQREGVCFVAESRTKGVIGWIHVSVKPLLETERYAEVDGLIVDENMRSHGAGKLLLEAGEKWAHEKRCKGMSVRSNVLRERAHEFYVRQGYEHYKTQKTFRKAL